MWDKLKLPFRWVLYDIAKITALPSFPILFRTKRYYANKNARVRHFKGKAILISNHMCFWDPLLLTSEFFFRRVRFLASQRLFELDRLFAWVLHSAGCIVVDKDAFNFGCITEMVAALEQGGMVGMFPEGQIACSDEILPFKEGVVMIALRTGAPILPIYISGGVKLSRRMKVAYGEPIVLREHFDGGMPSMQEVHALSVLLHERMQRLKDMMEARDREAAQAKAARKQGRRRQKSTATQQQEERSGQPYLL